MRVHLKKSNLVILPYKSDSSRFGTEALAAITAGVPVLVSRYCGLASLLRKMVADEAVVYENKLEVWADRIIQKLMLPEETQWAANRLLEQLFLDTSMAGTHLDFVRMIVGKIHEN